MEAGLPAARARQPLMRAQNRTKLEMSRTSLEKSWLRSLGRRRHCSPRRAALEGFKLSQMTGLAR